MPKSMGEILWGKTLACNLLLKVRAGHGHLDFVSFLSPEELEESLCFLFPLHPNKETSRHPGLKTCNCEEVLDGQKFVRRMTK